MPSISYRSDGIEWVKFGKLAYMVNDDVNNKAINIEIKVAQYSAKAILKAMKKIMEDAAEKSQPLADYLSANFPNFTHSMPSDL